MAKIIICGSRTFRDYQLMKDAMIYFCRHLEVEEVISGGQASTDEITREKYGADYLGEQWAKENNIPVRVFKADWNTHGKKAGYLRNVQMSEVGTHCIAFWDGISKGTKMMIDIAQRKGLIGEVIFFTQPNPYQRKTRA